MIKVGIAGATGYVGIELIHILRESPKQFKMHLHKSKVGCLTIE